VADFRGATLKNADPSPSPPRLCPVDNIYIHPLRLLGGVTVLETGLSLARHRDKIESVAVPQIGQNLHELD
jgi:hypothetical protein